MFRASEFILLGFLALFLSPVYSAVKSDTYYYSTSEQAFSACQAGYAIKRQFIIDNYGSNFYHNQNCGALGQFTNFTFKVAHYSSHTYKDFFIGTGCNSSQTPDPLTGECLAGPPPPTDEDCQARTGERYQIPVSVDENVGHQETITNGGCLFYLNFYEPTGQGVECSISDSFGVMLCLAYATGVSASQDGDSPVGDAIADAVADSLDVTQGGNASADEVIDFPAIEIDTPASGDTTTTQTKTDTTSYSPQENITNKSESVTHDSVTGGNKTKTETVETIQYSDGSTAVKTTTTTTVDDTTTISTTIDFEDGTYSQSTSTYNGSSSTRTKTDTTNADGSTSSTTTNEGDSPNNGRNEDEVSGTCLDDGSCNTEIDSSIATDKVDTLFDSAIATVTGDNVSESDFLPNFIELPSGTCANPSFSHSSSLASFNKSIDICSKTEDLRNGLGWLFYMMTIFAIYHIATRS